MSFRLRWRKFWRIGCPYCQGEQRAVSLGFGLIVDECQDCGLLYDPEIMPSMQDPEGMAQMRALNERELARGD